MSSLVCHQLSFAWPSGEPVFSNLTAAFPDGRTGLVGRNGVGKSTLLKVLAGELRPGSGTVAGPGLIGYLPQDPVLDGAATVAEVLGVADLLAALERVVAGRGIEEDLPLLADHWDVEERARGVLVDLGLGEVDLYRRLASLSGGEVMLLALARWLLARPDVLLLDEPTNNLDADARRRLREALSRWRGPVIVVSHDRELLDDVDTIAELRGGELRMYGGNLSAYLATLEVEQAAAVQAARTAKSEVRRQQRELIEMRIKLDRRQRYAKKTAASGVPKMVAHAKRNAAQLSSAKLRAGQEGDVTAAREELERAAERVRDDEVIRIDLAETSVPPSRDIAVVEDVVLRNKISVSLHLRGPERIAVTGPNGSGKTTLVDTLRGAIPPRSGQVTVRVPLRHLPQRLQLLADGDTVLAAVARSAPSADARTLRARLARFLLDAETISRPVATLSGGERFRANLAALLLADPPPQLLILDEPTNNLDLDSVAQLSAALAAYRGALLVVSHDQRFLDDLDITGRLELPPPSGEPARVVR
jgi:ATPase subunit of ABC transporter with duplicated ATPase domains